MHLNAGEVVGVNAQHRAVLVKVGADVQNLVGLGVVKAFRQGYQQRQLVDNLPVLVVDDVLVEAVTEVVFRNAVVPAGDGCRNQLLLVGQAKELGVLNHVGRVAGVAVKVDGDTDIVKQGRSFQQLAAGLGQAVQLGPVIEHVEGQRGNVPAVGGVRGVQLKNVLAAAFQNIIRNHGQIISFAVVVEEQALAQAAAGGDELFASGNLQQTADDAAARKDDIAALVAQAGDFLALLQVGITQAVEKFLEGLNGEEVVMNFGGRVFLAALDDFGDGTRRTANTYQGQPLLLQPGVLV